MSYYVEKREGKKKTSYRVQVIIKSSGTIIHREQRTFTVYKDAVSWGSARDKELKRALAEDKSEFEQLIEPVGSSDKLSEVIQRYLDDYALQFGRTVSADLKLLQKSKLAAIGVRDIKSGHIIDHVRSRLADGVSAPTAGNDLTRLQTVLDAAWSSNVKGAENAREELKKARVECRNRRLIGKSEQRDRLATETELAKLCTYFGQSNRSSIPMSDIIMFAVHSARRQDEITQLRWSDNDEATLTGVVPKLKDPMGNRVNVPFKYTQEAWDIAQRQPKDDPRIFPYNSRSVSAAFTRACKVLGIKNLRFHDLRHTAVTKLFEKYSIEEVPHFSLHRSWATLRRYYNKTPDQQELR